MHRRTSLLATCSSALLVATLFTTVTGCGPGGGSDASTPTDGAADSAETATSMIVSLQITPPTATLAAGTTQQFTATATLRSMATENVTARVTWASSDPSIVRIDAMGLATAVGTTGTATITASLDGVTSNSATVTVGAATFTDFACEPSTVDLLVGDPMPTQLRATARAADGTVMDFNSTGQVIWSSSDSRVASVDMRGRLTAGTTPGTTLISAQLGARSASQCVVTVRSAPRAIALDPPTTTLAIGSTQRFTVTATFADGRTADVTSSVTFALADTTLASLGTGADASLVTGRAAGSTTLTATLGSLTATATVVVTGNAIRAIAIEPSSVAVPVGTTQVFRAVATYSDGSARELTDGVMWSSSNSMVATIDADGLATGVRANALPVLITAAFASGAGSMITATAALVVTDARPTALSATLEPTGDLPIGGRAQLTVQATFSDGSSRDVTSLATFTSSAVATATVSSGGLVSGLAAGNAAITVSYMGQSAMVPVTVAGTVVSAIELAPAAPEQLAVGSTQRFTATARLSDGSTRDVTDDASLVFESSAPAVASISNAAETRGTVTGVRAGAAIITARYTPAAGGMPVASAPVALAVIDAQVMALEVTPRVASTPAGFTVRFRATGRLSDGTTRDLTTDSNLSWSSSAAGTASVSNLGITKGHATGVAPGTATITATYNAARSGAMPVTASATLTVSTVTLAAINIGPADVRVGVGSTRQYTATGVFSDGTTQDITEDVNWLVAPGYTGGAVSSLPGTRGLFTAGANPVARTVGALRATKTIGSSTVEGRAAVTVAGDLMLRAVRLQQGSIALPVAGRSFVIPQGTTVPLRAFGTFSDGATSEERELTNDPMATWNTSNPAVIAVSNAAGSRGRVTAVTRAAGPVANAQLTVAYDGFISSALTVYSTGGTCAVSDLDLTTDDRSLPGFAGNASLPANPNVERPAYVNSALNRIGRSGSRSLYVWANFGGAGCPASPLPLNVTDTPSVEFVSSATTNATVSNADGSRGVVSVPAMAPLTPAGETAADITARIGSIESLYQVIVTNACMQSLSIVQIGGARPVPVGVAATFFATARLADGTDINVGDGSLPGSALSFAATGLGAMGVGFPVLNGPLTGGGWLPGSFVAANAGTATITATASGVGVAPCNAAMPPRATAMLTVNTANPVSLRVEPPTVTIAAGASLDTARVFARFDDMNEVDVTSVASWSSSRPELTFPPYGTLVPANDGAPARRIAIAAGAMGNGVATASFRAQSSSAMVTIGASEFSALTIVRSLDITGCRRADGSYPLGSDIRLETLGIRGGMSNVPIAPSEINYTVSDTARASISADGVLSFNRVGSVTVTASMRSDPARSITSPPFTITDGTLASIATVPGDGFNVFRGTSQPFAITGDFGMGSTACPIALTRGVTWEALPTTNTGWSIGAMSGLATIAPTATPGTVTVIARYAGQTATTNGTIVPSCIAGLELALPMGASSSIALDESLDLTAFAVGSDGSRTPLSAPVVFSSSDTFIASAMTLSGSRVRVTPSSPAMPGMTTVTAQYNGTGLCPGVTGPVTARQVITVTPAVLRSITVDCTRADPTSPSGGTLPVTRLVVGNSATCVARGLFSDGSVSPVNAVFTATGAGTVSPTGAVRAGSTAGSLALTATLGETIGSLSLPVVDGGAPTITLAPVPALPQTGTVYELNRGVFTTMRAIASYDYSFGGGTVSEQYLVSELATWSSSEPTRVDVSNAAGSKGRTTGGASPGQSTITAVFGAAMGRATVDNSERELRALRVAFGSLAGSQSTTLIAGTRATLFVRGEYCPTGTPAGGAGCQFFDVTGLATLQVINPAIAAIESSGPQPQVRGATVGATAVRATLGMVTNDANVTVSGTCIERITLSPSALTPVVAGAMGAESSSHTFTVTATRSDGSTFELTDPSSGLANLVTVEYASMSARPTGWPASVDLAQRFTARFPTVGSGTYRAVFTPSAGALCAGTSLTSSNTTVLAQAGTLTSVQVVPIDGVGSVAAGAATRYRATANYTRAAGGTSSADITFNGNTLWSTGNTAVATHVGNPPGNVRGNAVGNTTVLARLGSFTGNSTVTVASATLASLRYRYVLQDFARNGTCNDTLLSTVNNTGFRLPVGGYRGRVVIEGVYSDGMVRDVTDQVSLDADASYASVAPMTGVVTTAATMPPGTPSTTLVARSSVMGVAAIMVPLTLVAGPLNSVAVNGTGAGPSSFTANLGLSSSVFVTGNFGTGAGTDFCITNGASFRSSNEMVATISSQGVLTPVALGTAVITASVGARSDTIAAVVGGGTPVHLALQPATLSLGVSETAQLRAIVTLSDGSTQDVTFVNSTPGAGSIVYFVASGAASVTLDTVNGDVLARAAGAAVIDACFAPAGTGAPDVTCTGANRFRAGSAMVPMMGTRDQRATVTVTP